MKILTPSVLLIISFLLFATGAGLQLNKKMKSAMPLSCISRHILVHGSFSLTARYFFSFYKDRGVIRINGTVLKSGKTYPISRMVFFSYIRIGDEYTLQSTHIEKMSLDQGFTSGVEKHLPSFLSIKDRQFTLTLHRDRFYNAIIIFTEVPVFYCVRRNSFI